MVLTANHPNRYQKNGFVLIEDAIPQNYLEEMQQVTARLIDQARRIATTNEIYDLDGQHSADNPRLNRIKTAP